MKETVSSTNATYCLVDGKREIYEAYETRDKHGIEYSTSDGRTLEEMETDISQYKNKDKLIHDVINYVEDHGGKCN